MVYDNLVHQTVIKKLPIGKKDGVAIAVFTNTECTTFDVQEVSGETRIVAICRDRNQDQVIYQTRKSGVSTMAYLKLDIDYNYIELINWANKPVLVLNDNRRERVDIFTIDSMDASKLQTTLIKSYTSKTPFFKMKILTRFQPQLSPLQNWTRNCILFTSNLTPWKLWETCLEMPLKSSKNQKL